MVSLTIEVPDEALRSVDQPSHRPMMTYAEAGEVLGISKDAVASLVDAGTLDRPDWTRDEVRVRMVTTASVYRAAGWPIQPLSLVIPN